MEREKMTMKIKKRRMKKKMKGKNVGRGG